MRISDKKVIPLPTKIGAIKEKREKGFKSAYTTKQNRTEQNMIGVLCNYEFSQAGGETGEFEDQREREILRYHSFIMHPL